MCLSRSQSLFPSRDFFSRHLNLGGWLYTPSTPTLIEAGCTPPPPPLSTPPVVIRLRGYLEVHVSLFSHMKLVEWYVVVIINIYKIIMAFKGEICVNCDRGVMSHKATRCNYIHVTIVVYFVKCQVTSHHFDLYHNKFLIILICVVTISHASVTNSLSRNGFLPVFHLFCKQKPKNNNNIFF